MSRSWPVLILLWCVARAPAQETPPPLAEEAPETLLQTTIGSSDVDMFLDGSWSAAASGVVGFMVRSGEGIQPLDAFPSLPVGFDFTQVPELTFSVWLQKHYFVEFTVLGSFEDNAFRAGYQSDEGLLRSLVVGNRGIAIDPYPYLTVPETGDSSLGAEATLVSGASRHEFLVRYDNNSSGKKVFVGKNEVEEFRIPLAAYEQGLQLRLPDSGVDALRLYLEDPDGSIPGGDGRRYRAAGTDDAIADAETGIVTLKARPFGRVLIYYTKGGLAIGDPGLGAGSVADVNGTTGVVDPDSPQDFHFSQGVTPATTHWFGSADTLKVSVEGRTALLLRERGVFSLFDVEGSYLTSQTLPPELWRIVAKVVERDGTEARGTQPKATLRVDPDLQRLVVTRAADPRSLANLYPLLDEDATRSRLYGPFRDDSAGLYSREILLQILTPITTYVLESDILAGSVSVTRNGNPETRFTVDAKTGVITFTSPIGPSDRLEITYKKKGALLDNGDLVLAWGNRFPLSEPFEAELAAGFRWNALPGAYSEKPFTHTGAVLLSGGVTGKLDNFDLNAQAAVSYAHPDTTGRLRLAGMEASGVDLSLDENLALPASPPGGGATKDNRGKLLYKDYREYGLLGSFTLQGPDSSIPSDQVFPYETGSKIGPYNVAGGNGDVDRSLVLDFDLQDGEWAGFEIPVLPGQPLPDLSSLEALITEYKMLEVSGTVDVRVEIGDVAEDVDADARLDEEPSVSSTGFLFNDDHNGAVLLVGGGPKNQGNERKDTEDLDGDGYLQTGDGSFVSDNPEITLSGATAWKVARHVFTSDDRKKLRRTRAIRVFVRESGGAPAKGRLLVDRVFLAGSTFAVTSTSDATLAVREVAESFGKSVPAKSLEATFKDVVRDVFHAGGETQEVLEIEWTGSGTPAPIGDSWTVRGFANTGTEGARYREVVHYLRAKTAPPGATLTFELLDDRNRGVHWSFIPSASDAWREVRVDTEKKRVTVDGSAPANASVSVDSHDSLVQLKVGLSGGDGSSGLIYVDEVHMASPIGSVGVAVGVDTELRVPGPLVRVRGVPVVSDLRVREIASTVSPGFSPLYGRPTSAWGGSSRTELGMTLPASRLDTHFVIDWTDAEATIGGGHSLQTIVGPVSVLDRFDLSAPGPSAAFDRESRVRVTPAPGTTLDAGALAATSDDRLTQTWSGTISSAAGPARGSLVTDLGLSTLDYVRRESGYFDSWILGYRLYAPVTAPLLERTSRAALELALEPRPVGLTLQLSPSTRSVPSGDGREQRDGLTARLAAPMALDNRGTLLTAAYQREMEITATQAREGGFDTDWTRFAGDLAAQSYFTSGIPFWELYASDEAFRDASADATSAMYKPQFQLALERRPGSRITHLFIPTKLEAALARDLEKEGALYSSLYVYSVGYQTNAINLFGRLGAYPTFAFYDLDEISNNISLALSFDRNETLQSADLRLDSLVGLEGGGGNQFTVSNRFALTGSSFDNVENTTSASYTWFVRPEGGVPLPLLGKDITREAFYAHDESLELTTTWGSKPATGLLRHRTEIRIPGHGTIAATAALGADFEKFRAASGHGYDWVVRFAAQAGIEALIRFGSGEPRRESEPAPRRAQEGRAP